MKKIILLIVFFFLFSNCCFARNNNGIIKNRRGLVVQALDNGALGYICPRWALCSDDCRSGQFVYFNFNDDFVDNQRFTIPKDYCLFANGVYKYTNKDNVYKTVRKVDLFYKY
ncbi:MAG: hypothetical protein IKU37_09220 [Candidatus Gastranaerophilales bacterium]|nr:hypothetical protein [Candidatus Gastranaerophilales bacterium]